MGRILIALALCLSRGSAVWATTLELSPSVAEEILSKTTTLVLNPPEIETEDFQLEWSGKPIDGVRFEILPGSLQWVRTSEVLMLPRGRMALHVANAKTGQIQNAGYTQSMVPGADGALQAELPIALISGDANPIRVQFERGGEKITGTLQVKHSGRAGSSRVFTDSSCSPYHVEPIDEVLDPQTWAYVGCRLVYTRHDSKLIPSFDVLVFWDGVSQSIRVDDVETKAASVSVWALRLRAKPGRVRLESGPRRLVLGYRVREELHLGSFGLGVGPYTYHYAADGDPAKTVSTTTAVATLYGSWFLTEYMRVVMFSAVPVHRLPFSDTGIYLLLEQTKVLDNRVSINLLLGGHGIFFPYLGGARFAFSFPQGIEAIAQDLPLRRHRLHLGAFMYPSIDGRSYYNVWVRWAYKRTFVEFNYISWEESISAGRVASQVSGVSVGFPLFQFL